MFKMIVAIWIAALAFGVGLGNALYKVLAKMLGE